MNATYAKLGLINDAKRNMEIGSNRFPELRDEPMPTDDELLEQGIYMRAHKIAVSELTSNPSCAPERDAFNYRVSELCETIRKNLGE